MDKAQDLQEKFKQKFGMASEIYHAPGRVNLIGEHTDYNDGFVMPAAIGFSCWVAIAARDDRKLVITSENFDETIEANLDDPEIHRSGKWWDYPVGVAWALQQEGFSLRGANIHVHGDIPLGAGLSSSAAIEISTGYALLDVSGHAIDRTNLARICRRAECEFVGARVGIMDQFVCCHGRAGHALILDCRSLNYRLIPLPGDVELVICNTMVKHQIASSRYNERRAECETGLRMLSKVLPDARALRDVTLAELEENRALLTETVYKRCRHVISENDRVVQAAAALRSHDIETFGELMAASHRSLREDYEVSCSELDLMVELASKQAGIHGSRMTGGGFGGCTINFVRASDAAEFQRRVAAEYKRVTGIQPDIYICEASEGAERVTGLANATAEIESPQERNKTI